MFVKFLQFVRFYCGFCFCCCNLCNDFLKAQHVLTIHFYFNSIYEELTSLRAKVIALEHDLHKSCQKASKNHDLCYQLEKVKLLNCCIH
ncbi:hypothetical protein NC653_027584 [Populus alba x Populus x berolinensis]|uniref:C2H2-type domain-containing protein n=1 Tax=Populus alba x Populus x berolinensis TaxID=444605 RepID=A0AAD6Q5C6_9ROSI|nr:hypothetical protein NC653_027584 [Populus alba x Populus x berolinensis]